MNKDQWADAYLNDKIKFLNSEGVLSIEEAQDVKDNQGIDALRSYLDSVYASIEKKGAEGVELPDDPNELASMIAQKKGVSFQDAQKMLAMAPRSERAELKGEMPFLSTIGDVVTAPARAYYSMYSEEPAISSMGRVKPINQKDQGFVSRSVQEILTSPETYIPIPSQKLGQLFSGLSKKTPMLARAFEGGTQAGLTSLAQSELGKGADREAGIGSSIEERLFPLVAGTSIGGFGAPVLDLSKKAISTSKAQRQAVKQGEQITKEAIEGGLENVEPMYRLGFREAESVTPKYNAILGESTEAVTSKDIPYDELLIDAQNVATGSGKKVLDPLERTYRDVVKPAIDDYMKKRSKIGAEIGNFRKKYIPDLKVSKGEILSELNETLADRSNVMMKYINDKLRVVDMDGDIIDADILPEPILKTIAKLDKMPENLTGNKMELIRTFAQDQVAKDPTTRMVINNKENALLKEISSLIRNKIDDVTERSIDKPSEVARFKELRKAYTDMSNNADAISRLVGGDLFGGETSKRGTSALKRVAQSMQDMNARALFDELEAVTGVDARRASARALQAMTDAGDPRATSLLKEMQDFNVNLQSGLMGNTFEGVKKIGGKVKEKVIPSGYAGVKAEETLKKNPSLVDLSRLSWLTQPLSIGSEGAIRETPLNQLFEDNK